MIFLILILAILVLEVWLALSISEVRKEVRSLRFKLEDIEVALGEMKRKSEQVSGS